MIELMDDHVMKQEVHATVHFKIWIDATLDPSEEILARLQCMSDLLIEPVAILEIKEEAEIYGNE